MLADKSLEVLTKQSLSVFTTKYISFFSFRKFRYET